MYFHLYFLLYSDCFKSAEKKDPVRIFLFSEICVCLFAPFIFLLHCSYFCYIVLFCVFVNSLALLVGAEHTAYGLLI